jgi:hypothetical protein
LQLAALQRCIQVMSLTESKNLDLMGMLHLLERLSRNNTPGSRHILSRARLHGNNFAKGYLDFETTYNAPLDSHHRAG